MVESYSIGFIGWNPFQFLHVRDLASAIPGSVFVIEKRKENIKEFSDDFLNDESIPVMVWEQRNMPSLDGVFDIIVCQTPFFRMETFEKTKIVMIQYGYAKEPHNYGAWRSLADLCLTYGDYANDKIKHFCPSVSCGNPRYDKWTKHETFVKCREKLSHRLFPNLKTILYVPTWGELSSIDEFLKEVMNLSSKYNVILKLHHNTDILEHKRREKIDGGINFFGANDDLLELISISDVVISDYSGAIFDAIYFNKPIILLSKGYDADDMGKKMDGFSLEFAQRKNIGYEVFSPIDLQSAVEHVLNNISDFSTMHSVLNQTLFTDTENAIPNAIDAMKDLLSGNYSLTQSQTYIRQVSRELLSTKRRLQIALKNKREVWIL